MAEKALALFREVDRGDLVLVIAEIVIAETVWVLQSFYGFSRGEIARPLQALLSHDGLEAPDKGILFMALNLYAERNVDFADAILAVRMVQQRIKEIYSFDHHFDRLPGITQLVPGE
jgi:predicted nucleic-acid-binding protein